MPVSQPFFTDMSIGGAVIVIIIIIITIIIIIIITTTTTTTTTTTGHCLAHVSISFSSLDAGVTRSGARMSPDAAQREGI